MSHSLYFPAIHQCSQFCHRKLGVHGQCTTTHTSQAAPPLILGFQGTLTSQCKAVDDTYAHEHISLYPSGVATALLAPSPAVLPSLDDRGSILLNEQTDRLVTSDVDAIAVGTNTLSCPVDDLSTGGFPCIGDVQCCASESNFDQQPVVPHEGTDTAHVHTTPIREAKPTSSSVHGRDPRRGDNTEHHDEGKRLRGRPQIHTKDQTATERRRTQIRIAQRAYRQRKDAIISRLEKKVDELKMVHEKTRDGVMEFVQLLNAEGVFDASTDTSRRLKTSTNELLRMLPVSE